MKSVSFDWEQSPTAVPTADETRGSHLGADAYAAVHIADEVCEPRLGAVAHAAVPAAVMRRRIDFSDIEHAIPNFDGEDRSHDVGDFLRVFEDIMEMVKADDTLRRKLKGAANCLTFTAEAASYEDLKKALQDEFGHKLTVAEAERMLRRRIWKNNEESLHRYVLEMQKLRRRLDTNRFSETEFVDLIVAGVAETATNTNLLMGVDTVQELKKRLDRYEDLIVGRKSAGGSCRPPIKPKPPTTMTNDAVGAMMCCFNCSKLGHYKAQCPYETRPVNTCFKCWCSGHTLQNCPNPKKVLKMKASAAARTVASRSLG